MMKAPDTRSTARTAPQQKQPTGNTFFNKEGSNAFFGESESTEKPFFVQRKLTIGQPDDHYEKQADHVADKVVQRMSLSPDKDKISETPDGKVQRKPIFDSMSDPPEEKIQRKPEGKDTGGEASSGIESRLNSTKGSGSPLPADTKASMESSIGADFSGVRVHTGSEAASLSRDLQAQAFTHGNDIYFNEGKYDTASSSGKHLLAHELTHTVQQGAAVQKKPDIQLAKTVAPDASSTAIPAEVVNVAAGTFNPSFNLREAIKATKHRGLDVRVSAGSLAGGTIVKVREEKGELESVRDAYLPLNIPVLSAAAPVLALHIEKGEINGYATVANGRADGIARWLRTHGKELSWLTGLDLTNIPAPDTNTFDRGGFQFTLNGIKVKVGGLADATMDIGFVNLKPAVHVGAKIDVGGVVQSAFEMNLSKDGQLAGEGTFGVNYKAFAGNINARFVDGVMDVKGVVSYDSDRLKGSLTLIMTDKKTADNFAKTQLTGVTPEEAVLPEAVPAPEGKGPRGMAGIGTLTFNMTEWFAGSVNVIVDGKGCVTVIGKIAPPKEIKLFEQKPYDKPLINLRATAGYGIPVLGTIGVFAEVSLSAIARIGPGTLSKIEITGTYSNNPDIAKSITLAGSLNISAYAGLRLRAAGGAIITIAGHDLKAGVGVNADAGVKGYVDARPTIGYRDPGEFFFKGHMEIAAQPVLGLGGEFFIELDSPWYSPLPDKKWSWPIGSLEYPLPGEFGLGADVDYVLGSGKVPDINFTDAKFDGSKFMTDLVDDNVPKKSGGDQKDKQGKFVDGNAAPKPPVAAAVPAPPPPGKTGGKPVPGAKGGKGKDKGPAKLDEMKNFADAMQKVKALEGHKPMTRIEISSAIQTIKNQHGVADINVIPKGNDKWKVTGSLAGKKNKQSVYVPANMLPGDEKEKKETDKSKEEELVSGLKYLQDINDKKAEDGIMERNEVEMVAKKVQSDKSSTFKSITVIDAGDRWKYHYIQRTEGEAPAADKPAEPALPDGFVIGAYVNFPARAKILKIKAIDKGKDSLIAIDITNPDKDIEFKISILVAKKSLTLNTDPVPPQRFFPASWGTSGGDSVRKYLYEYMNNYGAVREEVQNDPVKGEKAQIAKVLAVKKSKDMFLWNQYMNNDLIVNREDEAGNPVNIETYDPTAVKYEVDHKKPISVEWNRIGLKSDDAERTKHVVDRGNLRVITKWHNGRLPKEIYKMHVEPGFTSSKADDNNPEAKWIQGTRNMPKELFK